MRNSGAAEQLVEADWLPAGVDVVGRDFAVMLDELRREEVAEACRARGLVGIRTFVEKGEGHWDHYRIADDLVLTIVDATYRERTWIRVPGEGLFKVRVLLNGAIEARSGEKAEGACVQLAVYPGVVDEGYFVAPRVPLRMIILHCRKEFLGHRLALAPAHLPDLMRIMFDPSESPAASANLRLAAETMRSAKDIIETRLQFAGPLRRAYVEARCVDLICTVLRQIEEPVVPAPPGVKITQRDIERVRQARDILLAQYSDPPPIHKLARIVGLSQTKLKVVYKHVFGVPPYDMVRRFRMEAAAEMLMSTDRTIAEIAYEVGFEYPGNFTHAYSRFFGHLPSEVQRPR